MKQLILKTIVINAWAGAANACNSNYDCASGEVCAKYTSTAIHLQAGENGVCVTEVQVPTESQSSGGDECKFNSDCGNFKYCGYNGTKRVCK